VPGLCGMGAIFSAFQNPSFSIVAQKYQDILKDINSYPISIFEKVFSFILGGTFRGVLIGLLTYISTICFTGYHIENPGVFLLVLTVISFIFASLGVVTGLMLDTFEQVNFILSIILTPLAYFGGVFFEVTKLHGAFSFLVYLNPLFPLINMLRYGYLGIYEGGLMIQLIYIPLLAVISFGAAYAVFKKGIGLKS
ncbi:MAG TPA: ABC transporter permease, partial [Spirochaetota bacterium]|nr:ABC transporter permease [Spirochaetota bacterium]